VCVCVCVDGKFYLFVMTRALVFFGHSCVSHFFSTRPLLDDFIHFSQTERVFRQKARENKNFSKKAKKKSPKHPHNFSFSSSSRSSSSQRGYIYTHKGRARRKVVPVFIVKPLFSRREFSRKRERERVELLFFFPFVFLKPRRGQRRDVVDGFFFFFGEGDFAAGKTRR